MPRGCVGCSRGYPRRRPRKPTRKSRDWPKPLMDENQGLVRVEWSIAGSKKIRKFVQNSKKTWI